MKGYVNFAIAAVALMSLSLSACENDAEFWGIWVIISIPIVIGIIIFCLVNGDAIDQRAREANRWVENERLREEQKQLRAKENRRMAEHKRRITEARLERILATLAFDLATAFNNSDHAAAVETWRSPPNAPFTPDDLIEVMRDAQTNGQRWNGRKVDAILQSQWGKFLRETYADSRDDFMLTLHDMSKRP